MLFLARPCRPPPFPSPSRSCTRVLLLPTREASRPRSLSAALPDPTSPSFSCAPGPGNVVVAHSLVPGACSTPADVPVFAVFAVSVEAAARGLVQGVCPPPPSDSTLPSSRVAADAVAACCMRGAADAVMLTTLGSMGVAADAVMLSWLGAGAGCGAKVVSEACL